MKSCKKLLFYDIILIGKAKKDHYIYYSEFVLKFLRP